MTASFRHRSRWSALFAGAVLLLALSASQVAVALHDAGHPFHSDQSLCDAFLGSQLQAPGATVTAAVVASPVACVAPRSLPRPGFAVLAYPAQLPRAPPALPTI